MTVQLGAALCFSIIRRADSAPGAYSFPSDGLNENSRTRVDPASARSSRR